MTKILQNTGTVMLNHWMCTGAELQSSPFHSISCVYSGMRLLSFPITIYLLRLCSADALNCITAKDTSKPFHPAFLNAISLCIISLFSLGLVVPFSLLYRCFFSIMDFLRFLWSAVDYFYSSPDVQVKPAAQASQISPLQFSTLS